MNTTTVILRNSMSKFANYDCDVIALVDDEGTVRVYDDVADHNTVCHDLTAEEVTEARRKAGLVECQCGSMTGEKCQWVGPKAETVVVEWMPEHLRDAHHEARNEGEYPHNGALRLRVHVDCAPGDDEA